MIKRTFTAALMEAFLVPIISAAAFAQWAPYVPPGVPRTGDGKPDLSAPAPRTADGKPDLAGLWENAPIGIGKPGAGSPDQPPLATFFDVGANIKGGLPFQPWAAELR